MYILHNIMRYVFLLNADDNYSLMGMISGDLFIRGPVPIHNPPRGIVMFW